MCNNHILCVQKAHGILLYKETLALKENFSQVGPIRYSKNPPTSLSETKAVLFLVLLLLLLLIYSPIIQLKLSKGGINVE